MARKRSKKGPIPHKVLSPRGLHLEAAHLRQQGSNIHAGTMVVVGQDAKGEDIRVEVGYQCPKCGKRVRGPNHAEGDHHNGRVKKHTHR